MKKEYMPLDEAFEIVFGLAQQSALDGTDEELKEEAEIQQKALDIVHNYLTKNIY